MVDLSQTANPLEVAYTLGGFFCVFVFLVLLLFAMRDASRVRVLPPTHPDHMIASDAVLSEIIRLFLAVGILMIGLAAIVTPPARESNGLNPSVLAVTLFIVLLFWEGVLTLWGVKDLWFRRRLFARMSEVRLVCADTSFGDCPFMQASGSPNVIKPEVLVEPPLIEPAASEEEAPDGDN